MSIFSKLFYKPITEKTLIEWQIPKEYFKWVEANTTYPHYAYKLLQLLFFFIGGGIIVLVVSFGKAPITAYIGMGLLFTGAMEAGRYMSKFQSKYFMALAHGIQINDYPTIKYTDITEFNIDTACYNKQQIRVFLFSTKDSESIHSLGIPNIISDNEIIQVLSDKIKYNKSFKMDAQTARAL